MFQLTNSELTSPTPVLSKKTLLQDILAKISRKSLFLPLGNSLCVQISPGETECTWQSRSLGQLFKRLSKLKTRQ